MALKDTWVDKRDDKDYAVAQDINDIAAAVIDLENATDDIDTALDNIIDIQNSLIGGEGE